MRVLILALFLVACGQQPARDFPPEARARFAEGCPTGKPECDCMWDKITRTMTLEDFDAAMSRFSEQGLMDPRLTDARLECRDPSQP
jgi:hypothetical protein